MRWIDRVPLYVLVIVAIPLALAPFPFDPTPHLVEKFLMLTSGRLTASIDIFDLLLHGIPTVLLIIKLIRKVRDTGKARGSAV